MLGEEEGEGGPRDERREEREEGTNDINMIVSFF